MRLVKAVLAAAVAILATSGAIAQPVAASAEQSRVGTVAVVVDPAVYGDLTAHGVDVTALGRGSVVPFMGTVKIKLPIRADSDAGLELGGGIRFTSADSQLGVRKITIPPSALVTGTVRGSTVGYIGPASLFFQAASGSELGDTSLRYTFTFASYVNASFDTGFAELGLFGYSTTRLRSP